MAWKREPYPQEKWTQREEQIYAEGRKSAQGAAGPSPSGSGKRKRYVKTAAGERRYGQPIGTEIGNPRNRKAAEAQQDKESTGRYNELVGADRGAQSEAMKGLSDDQLQRLSRVAYSFRSSDPNVVRLRIGVASELARRGFNVNDFGGLGPKSGGGGSPRSAGPARAAAPRRKPSPYVPRKPKPARSAMHARKNDRRLRELSTPQLRKAVQLFSRVPSDKRQAVARVLVRQALELGAPHFLGESVIEAANLADADRTRVIELAGKWKHGWIPLDGTALASKMKGKTGGKRWWDGGSGGTAKGRVRGDGKMRVRAAVGVPKSGGKSRGASGGGDIQVKSNFTAKQRRDIAYSQHKLAGRDFGNQKVVRNSDTDGQFGALNRKAEAARQKALAGKAPVGGDPKGPWPRNLSRNQLREQHQVARDTVNEWTTKADRKRVQLLEKELKARGLKPKPRGELSQDQKRFMMDNPDYGTKYPRGTSAYYNAKDRGEVSQPTGTAADRIRRARQQGGFPGFGSGVDRLRKVSEANKNNPQGFTRYKLDGSSEWVSTEKRKPGVKGKKSSLQRSIAAGNAARSRRGSGSGSETKSMSRNQMLDEVVRLEQKPNKTAADRKRIAELRAQINAKNARIDARPKGGSILVGSYGNIPHPGKTKRGKA